MIGENFPYTNFHDMNLDWMIKIAKDFLDQYTSIQDIINSGSEELQGIISDGMEQLTEKANTLEDLLQAWYNEHSEDIAGELASAISAFQTQAASIGQSVIDSIPADYTALSNSVTNIINEIQYMPDGYFETLTAGRYYTHDSNNVIDINSPTTASGWSSAVIECEAGNRFIVTLRGTAQPYAWAFIKSNGQVITRDMTEDNISHQEIVAPAGTAYLVVNNANNLVTNPVVYHYRANATIETVSDTLDELYKEYEFVDGYYMASNGVIDVSVSPTSGSGWKCVTVPCVAGDRFIVSGYAVNNPNVMSFIDENGTVLYTDHPEFELADIEYTAPQNAAHIVVNNYMPWCASPKCALLISPKKPVYTVALDGSGDFTSFCEALYNTSADLIVKAGQYNIVNEYKALFGNTIFSVISDSYYNIGRFRFGPYISERTITFMTGAEIYCNLNGVLTVDGTHRFSAINLGTNATIKGMRCIANQVFYLIHDDFGDDTYYVNTIEDCFLLGTISNVNIIGGGCRDHSKTIIRNTYMNNSVANDRTLRYHNYNSASAEPTVIVEGCRASGYIDVCYYGDQATPTMKAYIHNNSSKGVRKTAESAQFTTDNVDLYAWANVIE